MILGAGLDVTGACYHDNPRIPLITKWVWEHFKPLLFPVDPVNQREFCMAINKPLKICLNTDCRVLHCKGGNLSQLVDFVQNCTNAWKCAVIKICTIVKIWHHQASALWQADCIVIRKNYRGSALPAPTPRFNHFVPPRVNLPSEKLILETAMQCMCRVKIQNWRKSEENLSNGINNCVQRRFDNVIKKDINEQRVDDENSKKVEISEKWSQKAYEIWTWLYLQWVFITEVSCFMLNVRPKIKNSKKCLWDPILRVFIRIRNVFFILATELITIWLLNQSLWPG